jgi:hypothetical protein
MNRSDTLKTPAGGNEYAPLTRLQRTMRCLLSAIIQHFVGAEGTP